MATRKIVLFFSLLIATGSGIVCAKPNWSIRMNCRNICLICATLVVAGVSNTATSAPVQKKPTIFAPGVISEREGAASPAFTPDGGTVFFMRQVNGRFTILESHRVNGKWSTPSEAPFSGKWRDLDPAMAPDGSYLLFVSNRPSKPGGKAIAATSGGKVHPGKGMNIWRVDRKGDDWSKPLRLPDIVNSSNMTFAPSIAADGSIYYIGRRESHGPLLLLRSDYSGGHYQAPELVSLDDDEVTIRDPAIAPDQSFIVFSSRPSGNKKPYRLSIAFATSRGWSTPVDLGDAVNGTTYDMGSRLGPDHRTLYYYNASGNILSVSLTPWLNTHGTTSGAAASTAPQPPTGEANRKPVKPQIFAEETVSTGHEFTLTFTPDMRTAYFTRMYPHKKIMHVLRTEYRNGKWQTPVPVSFSGSKWSDLDPALSPNGKRLFFVSTRPAPGSDQHHANDMDIWYSVRTGDEWGPPHYLKKVNSPGKEGSPTVSRDGTLCFFSDRNRKPGENSIYCSRPSGKGYEKPQKLGLAVNSRASDTSPYLTPNGKTLLFYSTRAGGYGKADLYASFRAADGWMPAENLGSIVNTAASEYNPELSPDGKTLYFGKNGNFFRIPVRALNIGGLDAGISNR